MKNKTNPTIETILKHKTVRKFKSRCPDDEMISQIVRAGQQAAFAFQMYSVILSRQESKNASAPLLLTICVDVHKFECIMQKKGWKLLQNDLSLLIFALQDASLAAQNMILAAESLGLGTCLLGRAPYIAEKLKKELKLPDKVFPMVQLEMGYPAEDEPVRPRYPLDYVLFEEEYPPLTPSLIEKAMQQMDEGYLQQDYYQKAQVMIGLPEGEKEEYTYANYSWCEHISRKCGIWLKDIDSIKKPLKQCGFDMD